MAFQIPKLYYDFDIQQKTELKKIMKSTKVRNPWCSMHKLYTVFAQPYPYIACESSHTCKDCAENCTHKRIIVRWQTKMADFSAVRKKPLSLQQNSFRKNVHLKQCPRSTEAVDIAVWLPYSLGSQMDRQRDRETDRQTDRQKDRRTERMTDRQTD